MIVTLPSFFCHLFTFTSMDLSAFNQYLAQEEYMQYEMHLEVLRHSKSEVILLQGKKGVWLKLPVERSELVPIAVKVTSAPKISSIGPLM